MQKVYASNHLHHWCVPFRLFRSILNKKDIPHHQIRAHLASIGHPIIGDYKYGDSGVNVYFKKNARITSQLLHASRFVFEDGREITAPCGAEFERAWNVIENL